MPITRECRSGCSFRPDRTTAKVQADISSVHSRKEPSCEPQAAVMRYSTGRKRDELSATFITEKSLARKDQTRARKPAATNNNWPPEAPRAIAIHATLSRAAPARPKTPCSRANCRAMIRATCPSSGIMGYGNAQHEAGGRTAPRIFLGIDFQLPPTVNAWLPTLTSFM